MRFGDPWTDEQAKLIDVLARSREYSSAWPSFGWLADTLEDDGLNALQILQSFPTLGGSGPGHASYGDVFFDHTWPEPPDDSPVGVTCSGLAKHPSGESSALTFVGILRFAAHQYRIAPRASDSAGRITVTSDDAARNIPGTTPRTISTIGGLLEREPIRGRRGSSSNRERGTWSVTFDRRVRAYSDIDIDRYLGLVAADFQPRDASNVVGSGGHGVEPVSVLPMSAPQTGNKVFISHASADAALGELLSRTLLVSGVPSDRIFYSSSRATGVPTGADVRTQLRYELSEAALVVELLTPTFFDRPMCLLELGGAWALDKSTYPIVVPPLELEGATKVLGEIQMGRLSNERLIDETFDELRDRLVESLGLSLRTVAWNDAVRHFKESLQPAIERTRGRSGPVGPAAGPRSSGPVSVSDVTTLPAFGGSTKVVGHVSNATSRQLTVILKAVFSKSGRIVETVDGMVAEVLPGASKAFEFQTIDAVDDFDEVDVQVEQSF